MRTEAIKTMFTAGTKIRLIRMIDEPQMERGLLGTVQFVDDIGQIHMVWDNGSTLALSMDDDFEVISDFYDIHFK